ncbi:MAG TPA: hypothetical protein VFL90_15255 [Methylomirabilota bacterium]|nr:hypothetical protein [Methylomirabilota bacterium]
MATYGTSGPRRSRWRRWRRRFLDWWFTRVQPPGSPNLWLLIVPLMLVGALVVAWLSGMLAGDGVGSIARQLVRNPFRPPRVPTP